MMKAPTGILMAALTLLIFLPLAGRMMPSDMDHGMMASSCIDHCIEASRPESLAVAPILATVILAVVLLLRIRVRRTVASIALRTFHEAHAKLFKKRQTGTVVLLN